MSRRLTAEAQCPVIVLPRGVKSSLEALMETGGCRDQLGLTLVALPDATASG